MSQQKVRFVRNQKFIFRQIVDEMILVPLHKDVGDMDAIYTLNEVGAFLWEKLEKPTTKSELESAILETFEVEPDIAQEDLSNFLDAMDSYGALERS